MEEQELRGERTLLPDEVSFIYGVHRQEERIQFMLKNDVATDDVFGMEPGTDDDVSMYAYYDLKRGEVSDALDVTVFEEDGSKTFHTYRLSPEEKKLLLGQMQPYCLELTGMRLEAHRERFQLEQEGLLPDPQGERPDAMKYYERQRRLAESGNGERSDENGKYEITDFAHPENPKLHRILALRDVGQDVKAGDLGGYVENEDNLSYEDGDDAWVYDDAMVSNNACVCEDSQVRDKAEVKGHAYVARKALVCEHATVSDRAEVYGALLRDFASVCGNAALMQSPETHLSPTLMGDCTVYGTVEGFVKIGGQTVVRPDEEVRHQGEKPLKYRRRKEIIFIDTSRHELFRLPDGENLVMRMFGGEEITRPCVYLDENRFVIGNDVHEIRDFAMTMERNGWTYRPEYPGKGDICDTYEIYQLKNGPDNRQYAFMPYSYAKGKIQAAHYELAYAGVLARETTLEDLFVKHNRDERPFGQQMQALSVSDVVVLDRDGKRRAFYVDTIGFQECKSFLNPPRRTRGKKPRKREKPER